MHGNSESTSSRPTDTGFRFLNPVIEKALTPSIFNHPPGAPRAFQLFRHWINRFTNYVEIITANPEHPVSDETKKMIFNNLISAEVYELFREAETYDDSLQTLKSLYLKVPNVVFARYLLTLRHQRKNESIDAYL